MKFPTSPSNPDFIKLLDIVGQELYRSHLVGGLCLNNELRYKRISNPEVGDLVFETFTSVSGFEHRYSRISNPEVGDLVIETSTSRMRVSRNSYSKVSSESGVGVLLRIVDEPITLEENEVWNQQEEGRLIPLEKVYYIRRLDDGSECRWVNADFVTIIPHEGWV